MGATEPVALEAEFEGVPREFQDPFAVAGLCDYVSNPNSMKSRSFSENARAARHAGAPDGKHGSSEPVGIPAAPPRKCVCMLAPRKFGTVYSVEGGTLASFLSREDSGGGGSQSSGRMFDMDDSDGSSATPGGTARPAASGGTVSSTGRSFSDSSSLRLDSPLSSGRDADVAPTTASMLADRRDAGEGGGQAAGKEQRLLPHGHRFHDLVAREGLANPRAGRPPLDEAQRARARARWRQLRRTLAFARNIAGDKLFRGLTHGDVDLLHEGMAATADAVMPLAAAAAGDGKGGHARAAGGGRKRPKDPLKYGKIKGRAALNKLIIQQHSRLHFLEDFYVSSFKVSLLYFILGMCAAPFVLSLLFTPLYLADVAGFDFGRLEADHFNRALARPAGGVGGGGGDGTCDLPPSGFTTFNLFANCMNSAAVFGDVFLYAVSVSTMFGGYAELGSRYLILVANIHTLMAQFLFVFLSGAVFSRMSRPAHPIRVAKKAIIRQNDTMPSPSGIGQRNLRTFTTRLVLTGPPPCELVDVKLCLTFRCYIQFPNGTFFCSMSDLNLVRSEVSHMRYGQTVRHIIDEDSPLYEHTQETLKKGDASFSLTISGMERSSMQPIFHMQEYYVHDGEVLWDVDYHDMVSFSPTGQRVFDHTTLDHVKVFKGGVMAMQAINRLNHQVKERREAKEEEERARQGADKESEAKDQGRATTEEQEKGPEQKEGQKEEEEAGKGMDPASARGPTMRF